MADPTPSNDREREPVREREVIVREGRSRGPGALIGAIIGVVVVLLLVWVLISNLGGNGEGDTLNVDVPDAEVNVDADEGG